MNILQRFKYYGVAGCTRSVLLICKDRWRQWRIRNMPRYQNPTSDELHQIERDLHALDIAIDDYMPSSEAFLGFKALNYFSDDYIGGKNNPVWNEKLLEHWIASEMLGLVHYGEDDVYVDVAAASSPWAHVLRTRNGIKSYAIDLGKIADAYRSLPYYRTENAISTSFPNASVRGASLQCAYEMFTGNDDIQLIRELSRILTPGGKAVVLPLYMHTHYCAYSTPEHVGKGYSDPMAKEYVCLACMGVPSSRKYNATMLKSRVLDTISSEGMSYRLLALRNKAELGDNIYCHFILEICKPI